MAVKDTTTNTDIKDNGRPLKFKTPLDLAQKIEEYFGRCDPHEETRKIIKYRTDGTEFIAEEKYITEQKPYLITGLARYLNVDRKTLINYKKRDNFFHTLQEAIQRCEEFAELQLYTKHANGAKFNLNVNYGWQEVTRNEHTGEGGGPVETSVIYRPEKLPPDYWKRAESKPKKS